MTECDLCKNDVPEPPVTGKDINGVFCCRGCLSVYRILKESDIGTTDSILDRIDKNNNISQEKEVPDNAAEIYLKVNGMHCTTCERFIEAVAEKKEGIYRCEASYSSEMAKVYYDNTVVRSESISAMLSGYGYTVYPAGHTKSIDENNESVARVVLGGFFSIIGLLLYSLFLYPSYLGGGGIVELTGGELSFITANIAVMTTFVLGYTGYPILRGAFVSLSVFRPNMNLLIAIAAVSAYLYSVGAVFQGNTDVYFDVSMAVIMVVSLGNIYEKKIKSGKNILISRLAEGIAKSANVIRDGRTQEKEISELSPGEYILVRTGERIPVDGTILRGDATIDETLITGESLPVYRKTGDHVKGGTVVTDNPVVIEVGNDAESTLDRLVRVIWNIQSSTPGVQRLADKIAAVFVPGALVLAIAAFIYHLLSGQTITSSLMTSLSVLIVSCPCALGLATPLAIASGLRDSLEHGIAIKNTSVFENSDRFDIIAFDKTGTLTTGKMEVIGDNYNEKALLFARSVETYSSHPAAKAITEYTSGPSRTVKDFKQFPRGVSAKVGDIHVFAGHPEWLKEMGFTLAAEYRQKCERSNAKSMIPVAVGWDGAVREVILIGDRFRDDFKEIIDILKKDGIEIALVSGDSEDSVKDLRGIVGSELLFSRIKPESKIEIIRSLKMKGRVVMIGDGSNDAPAIAEADLGIAFGPTALAADSSDVVILDDKPELIPAVLQVVRLTRRRIRQNLGWAFLYNAIAIPLAVAGLINPLFAAIAMVTSSLLVVTNSSRNMNLSNSGS